MRLKDRELEETDMLKGTIKIRDLISRTPKIFDDICNTRNM